MSQNILTKVAVIIPCYRVLHKIRLVLEKIGPEVSNIYVVDDCCPEGSGRWVQENVSDPRIEVIFNKVNLGVGGAVLVGFSKALADGAQILVKVDGDNQMDPRLIPAFLMPILKERADYTKGNRFIDFESVSSMPFLRKVGNICLTFLTKLSSGYWHVFDPTNGFFAIHASVAASLNFSKISKRYFFESDMLFRLNTIGAIVCDIPMRAKYEDENSSLKISNIFGEYLRRHLKNLIKRILYNYFVRDFNLASLQLVLSFFLCSFSFFFGSYFWYESISTGILTSVGTVMIGAVPAIVGIQLFLNFLSYDVSNNPSTPLHLRIIDYQVSLF